MTTVATRRLKEQAKPDPEAVERVAAWCRGLLVAYHIDVAARYLVEQADAGRPTDSIEIDKRHFWTRLP